MSKTLVIVESPAKGKKIEGYLGKNFKVMATKGHIADLSKGGSHNLGVDIENGFKPRYALMEDKKDLVDELLEEASESDAIWVASDPDREGEAIAWHLASKLAKCGKEIKRVEFHEITKSGIANGVKKPRELNESLFRAQEARRILDRIVGFMASPFLMNFFGSNLSAGRVQSVVTRMIVDREREIEDFKPETYFNIKACVSKNGKDSFWVKLANEKVTDQEQADAIKTLIYGVENDSINWGFNVTKVDAAEELKNAPPPMITSQLQKVMSKEFGMKPDVTMKMAQSLYENGHVTYIRTDSVRADPEAIKNLREYLTQQHLPLSKNVNVFKTKDSAQDAHECIRPTDLTLNPDSQELAGDEKLVYDVIWKYFVASQMEAAVFNTLKVTVKPRGVNPPLLLKASGKALKSKGYLEILNDVEDSKIEIPNLHEGDKVFLHGKNPIIIEKKSTQPPSRFTNASMIDLLEKKGIGRPATYAEVLSKIAARNYVELDGNSFRATPLGKQVTDALTKFFSFMEYNYTAELEKKLDLIENGKQNHVAMLEEFFKPFKEELDKAYVFNGSEICDKCKSPMKMRQGKNGDQFLGCSAYPKCYNTKSVK